MNQNVATTLETRKNNAGFGYAAMRGEKADAFKAAYYFALAYGGANDEEAAALENDTPVDIDRRDKNDRLTVGRFANIDENGTCAAFASFGAALKACRKLKLATKVSSGNMTEAEAKKALADFVGGRTGIKCADVTGGKSSDNKAEEAETGEAEAAPKKPTKAEREEAANDLFRALVKLRGKLSDAEAVDAFVTVANMVSPNFSAVLAAKVAAARENVTEAEAEAKKAEALAEEAAETGTKLAKVAETENTKAVKAAETAKKAAAKLAEAENGTAKAYIDAKAKADKAEAEAAEAITKAEEAAKAAEKAAKAYKDALCNSAKKAEEAAEARELCKIANIK